MDVRAVDDILFYVVPVTAVMPVETQHGMLVPLPIPAYEDRSCWADPHSVAI